jgi:hypothetical protein
MVDPDKYREGDSDEEENAGPEISSTNIVEGFTPKATNPPSEDVPGEACMTGILIVLQANGQVIPYNNIEGLERHHDATPHEIFRMCADVQDQISSIRTAGEILQTVDKMFKFQTEVVENNANKRTLEMTNLIMNLLGNKSRRH